MNCNPSADDGVFNCSGRLPTMSPGRHVLELSSVLNGVDGVRNRSNCSRITATVARATEVTTRDISDNDSGSGLPESTPAAPLRSRAVYTVRVVAHQLRQTTTLSSLPDNCWPALHRARLTHTRNRR